MDKDLLGDKVESVNTGVNPNELAFDTLWDVKPKREGDNSKQEAKRSFFRLLGQGVDADQIIAAARQWSEQTRNVKDRRTIPMVATWLNQRRFEGDNYDQRPTARKRTDDEQIVAFMNERGWHWNGNRWVRPSRPVSETDQGRRAAQPPLSLEQRANLFIAADLPWYPAMMERHRATTIPESYPGEHEGRKGVWVPKWWYEEMRFTTRDKVTLADINPVKARPLDDTPSQAPEKTEEIQQASPAPASPPKKTKSWSEEADQDFGG